MAMPHEAVTESKFYILRYTSTETTAPKKAKFQEIEREIDALVLRNAGDNEWLEYILYLCKMGFENQQNDTYCSHYTETLFVIAQVFLCRIDSTALSAAIQKKISQFEDFKKKNDESKSTNKESSVISGFENSIKETVFELAYWGHVKLLLQEFSLAEMKQPGFFPDDYSYDPINKPGELLHGAYTKVTEAASWIWGSKKEERIVKFEYSKTLIVYSIPDANIHYPLLLQIAIFEKIYRAKNPKRFPMLEEKKPELLITLPSPFAVSQEPDAVDEEKSKIVVPMDHALEWVEDLSNYSSGKTHGFDAWLKIRECAKFSKKIIQYAHENKSVKEWLDLAKEMGQEAHKAQTDPTFLNLNGALKSCSGFTETVSYVRLKLVMFIKERFYKSYQIVIAAEMNIFLNLREKVYELKISSASCTEVLATEAAIYSKIRDLAYLLEHKPLRALRTDTLKQVVAYGKSWVNGTIECGYQYSAHSQPFGLKDNRHICTSEPLCYQEEFAKPKGIYENKYEKKLKAAIDSKSAEETAEKTIQDLSIQLDELVKNPNANKLIELQDSHVEAFLAFEITAETLEQTLSPAIENIDARLQATEKFIESSAGNRKKELLTQLNKQTDRISGYVTALKKIQPIFQQEQIEKNQGEAKEEKSHAEKTTINTHADILERLREPEGFSSEKDNTSEDESEPEKTDEEEKNDANEKKQQPSKPITCAQSRNVFYKIYHDLTQPVKPLEEMKKLWEQTYQDQKKHPPRRRMNFIGNAKLEIQEAGVELDPALEKNLESPKNKS
ncbi:MAG TPA: hypothetical protein VLI69_07980 [Gammaproteobacteria bacterium]|nr:hypothetical protein [Gammaproteobacteria bacterium]